MDLLPTDVPAAQHAHEPNLTRVATAGRTELAHPLDRAGRPPAVRPGTRRGAADHGVARPVRHAPREVMTVPLLAHGHLSVLLAVQGGAGLQAGPGHRHHALRGTARGRPPRPLTAARRRTRHRALPAAGAAVRTGAPASQPRPRHPLSPVRQQRPGGRGLARDRPAALRAHPAGGGRRHGARAGRRGGHERVPLDAALRRLDGSARITVLRRLDAAVSEDGARRPATALLVQVDPARGTATLASAGHLPPVVFAGDGAGELLELTVGPPLRIAAAGGYEAVMRALASRGHPGDVTDGLVERRGEDIDASLARLAGLRLPPGTGVDAVLDRVLVGSTPARGGRRGAAGSPHPPPSRGLTPDAAVTDVRLPLLPRCACLGTPFGGRGGSCFMRRPWIVGVLLAGLLLGACGDPRVGPSRRRRIPRCPRPPPSPTTTTRQRPPPHPRLPRQLTQRRRRLRFSTSGLARHGEPEGARTVAPGAGERPLHERPLLRDHPLRLSGRHRSDPSYRPRTRPPRRRAPRPDFVVLQFWGNSGGDTPCMDGITYDKEPATYFKRYEADMKRLTKISRTRAARDGPDRLGVAGPDPITPERIRTVTRSTRPGPRPPTTWSPTPGGR